MKQVIAVRRDLKLDRGKMSVQVAHASLGAHKIALEKYPKETKKWERSGGKKVVVYVENDAALFELKEKLPARIPKFLVCDAGLTQLPAGTVTCLGIGPFDDAELDRYTGELKLV